jgi:hypothetical protein
MQPQQDRLAAACGVHAALHWVAEGVEVVLLLLLLVWLLTLLLLVPPLLLPTLLLQAPSTALSP